MPVVHEFGPLSIHMFVASVLELFLTIIHPWTITLIAHCDKPLIYIISKTTDFLLVVWNFNDVFHTTGTKNLGKLLESQCRRKIDQFPTSASLMGRKRQQPRKLKLDPVHSWLVGRRWLPPYVCGLSCFPSEQLLASSTAVACQRAMQPRCQLTGIREVGRSVHILETNKKDLSKIDIVRCLTTVRPALWPGGVGYDLSYVAELQSTPNSRGERALCVCALMVTKNKWCFSKNYLKHLNSPKSLKFTTGFPVVKSMIFKNHHFFSYNESSHLKWSFSASIWSWMKLRNIG